VNTRRMPHLLPLAAAAMASLVAYGAEGQEPDPNVGVTSRPRPDYDALGIRAGGFLIYPSTSINGQYNDNIFATKDNEEDDFIFTFSPQIAVRSNFPRHSLDFTVQSDVGRYVDHTDENFWDYNAEVGGRLDITRSNRLTAAARFGREHEERDDPEDPGADVTREPVEYYVFGGDLGFEQDFNRFNFGLLGTFDRRDYNEEDPDLDEDERDRNLYGARLRTGYFISPRINAFLQGGYRREQRDASNRSGRDNDVYTGAVGTAIDFTGLLFGEAFVGWSLQEFDDSQFDSENGLTYGVGLTWNPTQLTSLRLDGAGGFTPSDVGSSNLSNRIALRVDHELLRNVLIGGQVSYRRDDFQDADRTDNRFDVGPDITYLLNRYLSVGAGYTFTTRDSDDSDREFTRNLFTLRLNAQL
jgi:hypothetical protein